MYKALKNSLFIIFIFLFFSQLEAQTVDYSHLFNQGVINYRNNVYSQALENFESILNAEINPWTSVALIMAAKTAEKLDNPVEAEILVKSLFVKFPSSKYIADGHFILGSLYLKRNNKSEAFEQYTLAFENAKSDSLSEICKRMCDSIVETGLEPERIALVQKSYFWDKIKNNFQLWLAESCLRNGKKETGKAVLAKVLASKSSPEILEKAHQLDQMDLTHTVKIGVILPLSGYFAAESKDMIRGMALALNQIPQQTDYNIELVIADSKGNLVDAVKTARDLSRQDISLMIGELEDNTSIAISGSISQENLPLIVPVATTNGITSIGDYVFQANSDLENRGAGLAEFAVKQMNMKTFATLAPADEYGHEITDAFTKKVDQLGGTIITQNWYYPGTTNLKKQFDTIREAGFRYSFRDTLRKSGKKITQGRIDSLYAINNRKAINMSPDNDNLIESTEIPVNSIDGLFMPVYEEELSIIAPQMALANIKTTTLGGGYWMNEKSLRRQRNYLDGAVFVTGYYLSETDPEYIQFVNKFRALTAASPEKMSIYGYNLMNLLIAAVNAGNVNSVDISAWLDKVENFPGIGGSITFDENKVNKSVNILQFKDGNIYKIN